uniref:DUF19 domain-containing protein n=1 Tax=Haemonchus placei TaxID=6290 RepID=A0A0N4WAI2_HAEPC
LSPGINLRRLTVSTHEISFCNYVGLVKCFINILDEWAWTLYELKDNVVTITSDQCTHLRELDKCIKDDLDEQHQCSHREVIEVSNTVSDLLTHRKDSGSFLKSYYLLTYACSAEGQEILTKHRDCLKSEKIGEMTLSAGTYLSEKFLEHDDDEELNLKLQEYIRAMSNLCSKHEAAQLMCKSLTNMFKVSSFFSILSYCLLLFSKQSFSFSFSGIFLISITATLFNLADLRRPFDLRSL